VSIIAWLADTEAHPGTDTDKSAEVLEEEAKEDPREWFKEF
jgi:hypothetical protein